MGDRPNILLIVFDQFRADLLEDTSLGRAARLPALRSLMQEAVTFSRHYTVATPCGPSRASLLTGQYAMNHRSVRNGTPLRHDTPNLATEARRAGYDPLLFGYTDTTRDPRTLEADDPRLQTFEEMMPGFTEAVRMRMESDDGVWRDHLASKGVHLAPFPDCYRPVGDKLTDPAAYSAEDSDTAFLTDRFIDFSRSAAPGWFATLTYVRPHPPFVAPEPYNTMFDPADMPSPDTTGDDRGWHPFMAPAQDHKPPAAMVEGFPDLDASPETTATLRALYLGLCAELDHHIGRIVDVLKKTGQWDNTVLVITSDHGEMLGDFGLWGKGTFHEAAFRVPLIIRDPAKTASHGQLVDVMTQSIDITPSLLDRMGADIPHSMDGRSLLPLLQDTHAETRSESFSEFDFGNPVAPTDWQTQLGLATDHANLAVYREGNYRLVHFGCDLPPVLFDMQDCGERVNLADTPENTALCLRLSRQMLTHRMRNPDGTFARTIVSGGVQVGGDDGGSPVP